MKRTQQAMFPSGEDLPLFTFDPKRQEILDQYATTRYALALAEEAHRLNRTPDNWTKVLEADKVHRPWMVARGQMAMQDQIDAMSAEQFESFNSSLN